MPFLLAEVLNFQCTTHLIGVGSLSNLTNNICKYADIDEQVVMETVYSKNIFEICISNTVCKEKSLLESTGLGLKNVELLMRRMHGRAIYETKEYCYYVKLRFPITN